MIPTSAPPPTRSPIALSAREMAIACALILAVFAIGVGLKASGSSAIALTESWTLGGDFIELYTAGRVLNDGQGSRPYDQAGVPDLASPGG